MATCINCGKKLNAFNGTYPLWEETSDKFCSHCWEKFDDMKKKVTPSHASSKEDFISSYGVILKENGFTDSGLNYIADYFDYSLFAESRAQEKARQEKELADQKASILISSGFSFEGYRITKYSGYISGDDAVQIPRSSVWKNNDNGQNLTDALVKIRRQALKELKEAAFDLGCNAVIGVDFDYITLEPERHDFGGGTALEPYVICVTANGTAVVIEKE